jgi:hypothetical protein
VGAVLYASDGHDKLKISTPHPSPPTVFFFLVLCLVLGPYSPLDANDPTLHFVVYSLQAFSHS